MTSVILMDDVNGGVRQREAERNLTAQRVRCRQHVHSCGGTDCTRTPASSGSRYSSAPVGKRGVRRCKSDFRHCDSRPPSPTTAPASSSHTVAGGKATEQAQADTCTSAASDYHDNDALPLGARRLHAHAAILIVHSSELRAKRSRWSGPDRPVRINIELDDEAEVAAFEDVMWATVRDRLDFKNAQAAMLERAGGLEVAMNDQQLRKQLLELPEAAIVALLSDDQRLQRKARWWRSLSGSPLAWREVTTVLASRDVPQVLASTNEHERPKASIAAAEFKVVLSLSDLAEAFTNAVQACETQWVSASGSMFYAEYRWYLQVTIAILPGSSTLYSAGVYVRQALDANSSLAGFVKRNFSIACITKDSASNTERSALSGTINTNASGWADFFGIALGTWDADKFEWWTDDAGNLTFDVRIEV
ncbi:hypothetical protein JKP88DRAFT_254771 [Tribonema minus]|uniref:Uncharacterized protein n=1 Tax=Tribonema minus TaxID=303371 RepID=A0A836CGK5_9STRA|nr:hypothetical protein JKP88DRAFT_254771 [Tribonema minus]